MITLPLPTRLRVDEDVAMLGTRGRALGFTLANIRQASGERHAPPSPGVARTD